jgi:prepilin-type processing-associated H-X9-DG protein
MYLELPIELMAKKAFTLVELLVIIAVISILMAVLVPVLARARQQGKTIVCLSNLRQMCIAAACYSQIYDGYYPIAYYSEEKAAGKIDYCWDFTVIDESGEISIEPGLLWEGETIEKIHQCPSFKGDSNTQYDPYTGYNYNTSYIGHGQFESCVTPARADMVRRPDQCVLFGDGQWENGANKFMRAPWPNPGDLTFGGRYAGTQGYRHSSKTNVAWCDGHATSQKELYTESTKKVSCKIEKYNEVTKDCKIGFLSPDNSAYDLE